MGAGSYSHTTRAEGLTLTANIYNSDHVNHITNHNFVTLDDYSSTVAEMESIADPYPGGVASQATSGAGELERLRYVLWQQHHTTKWEIYPDFVAKTSVYTATLDDEIISGDASGGNFTITLPTAVGNMDKDFTIVNIAATGTVTIDGNAAETINGATTIALDNQWEFITFVSDNANWVIIATNVDMVTLTGTQTLTNKTLTTPTIGDLQNATHDHQNAAGGGLLSSDSSFSAYRSADQDIANSTYSKIQFNTEEFDTNNDYDNVTNYRFTPTIAGKYFLSTSFIVYSNLVDQKDISIYIYKNGVIYKKRKHILNSASSQSLNISCLVDADGSSDYFEIFIIHTIGSTIKIYGETTNYFVGFRIR